MSTFPVRHLQWWTFFLASLATMTLFFAKPSPETAGWLSGLGVLQLAGAFVMLRRQPLALPGLCLAGWQWALLVLSGMLLLEQAFVEHVLSPRVSVPIFLAELLRLFLLIGLVEELWFRGIWFDLFRDRPWLTLGAGSLLFGLYHAPHGLQTIILTGGVGVVFAAARARGASILVLAMAHGVMDVIHQVLFPGLRFRFDSAVIVWLFPLACLTFGLIVLKLPLGRPLTLHQGDES